jgi:sedoheptulose-bisphosphatase
VLDGQQRRRYPLCSETLLLKETLAKFRSVQGYKEDMVAIVVNAPGSSSMANSLSLASQVKIRVLASQRSRAGVCHRNSALTGYPSSSLYGTHMPAGNYTGHVVVVRSTHKMCSIMQTSRRIAKSSTRCEAALGDSLEEFLAKATAHDERLGRLLVCMGEAIRTIAFKIRTASYGATACMNTFGDQQLEVDMLANKVLLQALHFSHVCKFACSEEEAELVDSGGPSDGFSVAFDPLDGSSVVDANITVGTIFGVWPGDKLTGVTGRDQVAAAMGVYGPRTTYVIAIKGFPGTHEFLLMEDGKWSHVKETTVIKEGKLFSPGNLRATFDNPEYDDLIRHYVREKYTLRYTGGMVPDVNQIIAKERGVFMNVISPTTKAKLRLLIEVAPLGLLVENAGGHSSDGWQSVLDKLVTGTGDRTQAAFGSKEEIIRFEEALSGTSRLKAELLGVSATLK